ncbi:DNA-binding transcriptional regulator, MerR family [Gemmobacter megaterium]|uniref:DNA-binding transcriptional regulator, MerR family n=1 Tax=Gemmobacter megaterium TaxID=1086013 RepID=A0A1N7LZ20_9RHOB|nr:MerR family transcriptional regulator [Gemmobacter megaterium]GGE09795.1 MerR family transcriptional regulator [Gemmobacter megaterium]SIS79057.1 DNA-binding transcriptional regulator, MerR family [Gemmobacter megaterium]
MEKSPDAFRTISEVADLLEVPAHVLRFWESRFTQIRPVKRAGGRRYYRPTDVALLAGIRRLLHDQGITIRGVQKILREQGVRHVCELADQGLASDAQQEWSDEDATVVAPPPAGAERVIPWPGPRQPDAALPLPAGAVENAETQPQADGPSGPSDPPLPDSALSAPDLSAPDTQPAPSLDALDEAALHEPAEHLMVEAAPAASGGTLSIPPEPVADDQPSVTDHAPLTAAEEDDMLRAPPEAPPAGTSAEGHLAGDDPPVPDLSDPSGAAAHPFEGLPLFAQPPAPVSLSAPVLRVPETAQSSAPDDMQYDMPLLARHIRRISPSAQNRMILRDIARDLRLLRDRIDGGHV